MPLRFRYRAPLMGLICTETGTSRLIATLPASDASQDAQLAFCWVCRRVHRLVLATPAIFCAHPSSSLLGPEREVRAARGGAGRDALRGSSS